VVGVADEVHEVAFSLQENLFEIYLPWSTHTPADDAYLVARGADRRTTVQALRQSLSAVAPDVPMRAQAMEDLLGDAAAEPRFQMTYVLVVAGFAAAMLLACAVPSRRAVSIAPVRALGLD